MIKFDKDVHAALKTLEKEGFETYAAGECVRNIVIGVPAYDWDLVTTATLAEMKALFPQGEILDEEKQIVRVDYTREVPSKEEDEPSHIEGAVVDIHHIDGNVDDLLAGKGFTVNAMADNPEKTFVDPYKGRDDIKARLIRVIGDADQLFKKEPARMMEAVRLAAELGFDLQKNVFDAILSNWRLLLDGDITPVREELERIVTSPNAGKGLTLMAESGLMAVVFGEEVSKKMSAGDMKAFETVCENIDKTKPVRTRRLGLLYTILPKKRGLEAIDRMEFDEKTQMHLHDAMTEMLNVQFLNDDLTFKRYIHAKGLERYDYMHNLAKAQRIVYDQPTTKIESRNYMMKTIISNKEPIFAHELAIDGNDILEAGITDSPEKAEELLEMVLATVHKNANNNKRDVLLQQAKKFAKSKLSQKTRYVKWIK